MSAPKTFKIFDNVKDYLNTLCTATDKCSNFSGDSCVELIEATTKNSLGQISENNLKAFEGFAIRLKITDTPLGFITIKNKLKEIFKNAKPDASEDDTFFNNVLEKIKTNATEIDMNARKCDDNATTYMDSLKNVYENNKTKTGLEIYDLWETNCFKSYTKNQNYFKKEIKDKLIDTDTDTDTDTCQKKILNEYFNIRAGEKVIEIDRYIKDTYRDSNFPKPRLNMIVADNKAKITELLPKSLQDAFNEYLKGKAGVFAYNFPKFEYSSSDKKYTLKVITDNSSLNVEFKVDPNNMDKILKWIKKEQKELGDGTKIPEHKVPDYKEDKVPDDELYYDKDTKDWKWDESFEIKNFTDLWRIDRDGQLYKKDDKGRYVKYTDDEVKKDAENFKNKCLIYDNSVKCQDFFKDMVNGTKINELSAVINDDNFVTSYQALKDDIVNVNPVYIIGTLKMFGFKKYTKINPNGDKCVKIEDFSNWWKRQNIDELAKFYDKSKKPYMKNDPITGVKEEGTYPGIHSLVDGVFQAAPANMELFFKLLIAFINNNEFILNPINKSLINKSGKPKVRLHGAPKQMLNGKENPIYIKWLKRTTGKSSSSSSVPDSLSGLKKFMNRKNILYGNHSNKPIITYDNLDTLELLHLLSMGVSMGGKISMARLGHGRLTGGSGDATSPPCAKDAGETLKSAVKLLSSKNILINDEDLKEINDEIANFAKLENDLITKLQIIAKYKSIINTIDEKNIETKTVGIDNIKAEIDDFEKSSKTFSEKSDGINRLISGLGYNGPSGSFLSEL